MLRQSDQKFKVADDNNCTMHIFTSLCPNPKVLNTKTLKIQQDTTEPLQKMNFILSRSRSAIEETLSWLCFTEWILLSQSMSLSDLFMTERR